MRRCETNRNVFLSSSMTCSRVRVPAAILATASLLLAATSISAEEYSVQIGAFRKPAPSFTEKAAAVGKLYTTKTASGLTRIQVGRFASKQEAAVAKAALLGAGYADAFVVRKGVAAARTSSTRKDTTQTAPGSPRPAESGVLRASPVDRDPLAGVPEDLRDRVVILDGRLHVVEGDQFTPLDEYERPRY